MNDYLNPSIGDTLLISLIGFFTVFVVLVALMGIIMLISKLFGDKEETVLAPAVATPEKQLEKIEKDKPYTGVNLHSTDDKTAAILMAIVANNLQKPLDKLRFISIREVK